MLNTVTVTDCKMFHHSARFHVALPLAFTANNAQRSEKYTGHVEDLQWDKRKGEMSETMAWIN